jgi:hypothetical protein
MLTRGAKDRGSRGRTDAREGVAASNVRPEASSFLTLTPNPLASGFATVRYNLPRPGPATLRICDVAGRTVLVRALGTERRASSELDLKQLAAGVYVVRLDTDGWSTRQKLVIQR